MQKKRMNGVVLTLMLGVASVLGAQGHDHDRSPADTGRAARMQRMAAHINKELGLTDDQAAKLKGTFERFEPQRRRIMERQRSIREALRGQLQPGVAANGDSVSRLLDAKQQNRAALVQLGRDADRDLAGFLSPVQRARLEMMRERMMAGRGRMHGGPGRGMHGMHGMDGQGWDHRGGHGGEQHGGDGDGDE